MEEESNSVYQISGYIVAISFISIIIIFSILLFLGSTNNFVLSKLLDMISTMSTAGTIPSNFYALAESSAETYSNFFTYLDYGWFVVFISMIASSFVFSYYSKRENYFSLFSLIVLGLILITFVGGIFIQLTSWFETEILLKVFPTFTNYMPIFAWYLNNIGIINLIIVSINIILNFVDLDLSKFSNRKNKDNLDEI